MSRKKRKNEKSGLSVARFRQIWYNLKRFQQIVKFFPDICPGKNEKTKKLKKWIIWSSISPNLVQFEDNPNVQFYRAIGPGKNEKIWSPGARSRKIKLNLKRFQQIVQFFPDKCSGKNEKTKKKQSRSPGAQTGHHHDHHPMWFTLTNNTPSPHPPPKLPNTNTIVESISRIFKIW